MLDAAGGLTLMDLGDVVGHAKLLPPRVLNPREQAQHELFIALANVCADRQASVEMIAGAAINLIITVVHRMHLKQGDAEMRWDDLWGQGKELLKSRFAKKRAA